MLPSELFKDLGMTHAESAVYLSLLELGMSHAGPIIEKTALQTSVVHRALNSLIEKGLINFIYEGKRRVYQSTKPALLLKLLEEKKARFEQALPELEKQYSFHQNKELATVYKGTNGIREIYHFMIDAPGKEYLTFGGGPPTVDIMGFHFWMNLHRKRIDKKLSSRQVFDLKVRSLGGTTIETLPLTRIRYVSAEFAQFQETVIVGEYVAIAVFTKQPYAFLIKDAAVAEGYKKHFETLWQQAKKL